MSENALRITAILKFYDDLVRDGLKNGDVVARVEAREAEIVSQTYNFSMTSLITFRGLFTKNVAMRLPQTRLPPTMAIIFSIGSYEISRRRSIASHSWENND